MKRCTPRRRPYQPAPRPDTSLVRIIVNAELDQVIHAIETVIGIPAQDVLRISRKARLGYTGLIERLIAIIQSLTGDTTAPLQALIVDS